LRPPGAIQHQLGQIIAHGRPAGFKRELGIDGISQVRRGAARLHHPLGRYLDVLDQTLGAKGANNGSVYQFSIPRAEPIKDGNVDVPPPMGSANLINFQPTGGGKVAITGDLLLKVKEVNPVLKALRDRHWPRSA